MLERCIVVSETTFKRLSRSSTLKAFHPSSYRQVGKGRVHLNVSQDIYERLTKHQSEGETLERTLLRIINLSDKMSVGFYPKK